MARCQICKILAEIASMRSVRTWTNAFAHTGEQTCRLQHVAIVDATHFSAGSRAEHVPTWFVGRSCVEDIQQSLRQPVVWQSL